MGYVSPITFFFNDTATTEIYTLSLHDALPICPASPRRPRAARTWPGADRSSLRSITSRVRHAGLEAAVAAVRVHQDFEVDAALHRIVGEHLELRVVENGGAERAARPRADDRDGAGVEHERAVGCESGGGRRAD